MSIESFETSIPKEAQAYRLAVPGHVAGALLVIRRGKSTSPPTFPAPEPFASATVVAPCRTLARLTRFRLLVAGKLLRGPARLASFDAGRTPFALLSPRAARAAGVQG
jgi:hypothetical protein